MTITLENVNWLAVAVTAIAIFLLGGMWYTALFGNAWKALHGFSDERIKEMQASRPPALFFTGMIVCYVVIVAALATVMSSLDVTGAGGGLTLAALAWLIVSGFRFTGWLADERPLAVFGINAGFDLVALLVAGAILGMWR